MSDMTARIAQSFNRQGFMHTLGATLESVDPGKVSIHMPHAPGITQQNGFAHAGSIATITDSACGYAALTLMEEGKAVLTSEFKIHLLAPAMGEHFVAEGKVLRAGKRMHVVEGNAYAVQGGSRKHIAVMLATMVVIDSAESGIKT